MVVWTSLPQLCVEAHGDSEQRWRAAVATVVAARSSLLPHSCTLAPGQVFLNRGKGHGCACRRQGLAEWRPGLDLVSVRAHVAVGIEIILPGV